MTSNAAFPSTPASDQKTLKNPEEPCKILRGRTVRTRCSRAFKQPSLYSTYSNQWDYVNDDYYGSIEEEDKDGANDSDSSGQGHIYPNPYSPNSPSKVDHLKSNLQISTSKTCTMQRRDTTVSVKNMLSDLNDTLRTNADRFAWKKSGQVLEEDQEDEWQCSFYLPTLQQPAEKQEAITP